MAAMGNVTEPMMSGFSGTSNPRLPVAILSAALFGMALTSLRAADFEEPLSLFSQASSWMHTAAEPVGVEFFADYCGVIQGNPVGGQSQGVAYSQYLPFGFEWKEPLGWRGGSLRVSGRRAMRSCWDCRWRSSCERAERLPQINTPRKC